MVEETFAYFLGGGLGGTAKSLLDDYAGSLPVFLMFIIGWYIFLKRYKADPGLLFLFSGLHGFLIEIVFTGAIYNFLEVLALGGAAMFIYSTIIVAPKLPEGEKEAGLFLYVVWFFIIFILILIGGIIAVNLRAAI